MKSLGHFARNISIVAGAQALTLLATFLFTFSQARYLTPARFGELSLALSISAILMLVIDFGLNTKLARDVAQHPAAAGQALAATLVVRVGIWCLATPLVWLGTAALGYDVELQTSILILGLSVLFGGVAASLVSYFQGREEFQIPSIASIVQRGSAAALGVGALALGHGILVVAGVYVVASVLQVLVLLPGLRKYPISGARVRPATVVDTLRGTATLGFFWMLGAFYYNVDIVILQKLVPPENLAWYAAAYRLFGVALALVSAASSAVLYPVISRLSVSGPRGELRLALERTFTFSFASGVFVALVAGFAADEIVALLFPAHAYAQAATALRLLAPAIVAIYANGPFFLVLLGMARERQLLVMAAVLAVLNPIANVLLIPLFQQNASAAITTVTEAVVLAWVLALTPKDMRGAANPVVAAKLLVAAVPTATCLWLLHDVSIFVVVPAAWVIYVAVALALGTVPANDLRRIRGILRAPRAGQPDSVPVVVRGAGDR